MNATELTKFWRQCALRERPYMHPCDEGHLHSDRCEGGYAEYVKTFEEDRLSDTRFHLGLLPQPYHGNIEKAEVIILLKNPGFHASDYIAEENCPEYRQSVIDTIQQRVVSHMFLNPKWAWTGGFTWWERKLRAVAWCIARRKFDDDYPTALADLAKRTASLDLVPYHAVSIGGTTRLASAEAAKDFARKAAAEGRVVVIPRAVKDWDIKGGSNVVKYEPGQARSASLGPNSPGGQAILKLYGLQGSDCE